MEEWLAQEIVIPSGALAGFIARGAVEGPAVSSQRLCLTCFPYILSSMKAAKCFERRSNSRPALN
jgi:hypothetical protein